MPSNINEPAPERLLRLPEVISQTGLNRNSIYQIEDFPKPIKIGENRSAWLESDVQEWISECLRKHHAGGKYA